MYLEFAVLGTWYPYLANYLTAARGGGGLGFSSGQAGWVLGFARAVGAVAAPFIGGRLADRHLNAERALAGLHCVAAVLLFANASSPVVRVVLRRDGLLLPGVRADPVAVHVAGRVAPGRPRAAVPAGAAVGEPSGGSPHRRCSRSSCCGRTNVATNVGRIPMAMRGAGVRWPMGYAACTLFSACRRLHRPANLPDRAVAAAGRSGVLAKPFGANALTLIADPGRHAGHGVLPQHRPVPEHRAVERPAPMGRADDGAGAGERGSGACSCSGRPWAGWGTPGCC